MPNLHTSLQKYFGYTTFRENQEEIITDILNKKDTFALMPTGHGKSLCYQLPSIIMPGTTIVISPLISLMEDQVNSLTQNGVPAAFLNSSLTPTQQYQTIEKLKQNQLKLLFIAPERLVTESFLQLIPQLNINFFAIDEAHCISHWGHDFRPEYRELNILRNNFPSFPIIALTATATQRVKEDIIKALDLKLTKVYQSSFNRPNLSYYVHPKQETFEQVLNYIQKHKQESGIIYCQSRKKVDTLVTKLKKQKINALPYHAGLTDETRKTNQNKFIKEDADLIVATIAFGMGINKPNVRYVIHFDLPKSLENYYQETGRAGRDGLPSECILFFSLADKFLYERFIDEMQNEKEKTIARHHLQKIIDYAQSKQCRRKQLLSHFNEAYPDSSCASCDNCIAPPETFDATVVTQKILSCIYKTGQRFGPNHIIEVLTGAKSEKVHKFNHDQLSTYNIVQDYSRKQLKSFIYELVSQGVIKQSDDEYVTLTLTPKSKLILTNTEKVHLTIPRKDIAEIESKDKVQQRKIKLEYQEEDEVQNNLQPDNTLFTILRTLRKTLADKANLPPYVIFPDTSLIDMATYYPQDLEHFKTIYGVGQNKLEKYAPLFITEIKKYCQEKNISQIEKTGKKIRPKKQQLKKKRPAYKEEYQAEETQPKQENTHTLLTSSVQETVGLYKDGYTIEEIADQKIVSKATISEHLERAYRAGLNIDPNKFINPKHEQPIRQAFQELGQERLSPIKQKLGDDYTYEEIRWVRATLQKGT
jgi:ATP-dependent DNA helicase RecQ